MDVLPELVPQLVLVHVWVPPLVLLGQEAVERALHALTKVLVRGLGKEQRTNKMKMTFLPGHLKRPSAASLTFVSASARHSLRIWSKIPRFLSSPTILATISGSTSPPSPSPRPPRGAEPPGRGGRGAAPERAMGGGGGRPGGDPASPPGGGGGCEAMAAEQRPHLVSLRRFPSVCCVSTSKSAVSTCGVLWWLWSSL